MFQTPARILFALTALFSLVAAHPTTPIPLAPLAASCLGTDAQTARVARNAIAEANVRAAAEAGIQRAMTCGVHRTGESFASMARTIRGLSPAARFTSQFR